MSCPKCSSHCVIHPLTVAAYPRAAILPDEKASTFNSELNWRGHCRHCGHFMVLGSALQLQNVPSTVISDSDKALQTSCNKFDR